MQSQRKAAQVRLCRSKGPPGSPSTSAPLPLSPDAQRTAVDVAVRRRAKYETVHKGAFELVFPASAGSTSEKCYAECLQAARERFESHHTKRNQNVLAGLAARRLQVQVSFASSTHLWFQRGAHVGRPEDKGCTDAQLAISPVHVP
jgi:hypothetical protein